MRIVALHCDPSATQEYDLVASKSADSVPGNTMVFDQTQKTLVVLRRLNFVNMRSEEPSNVERTFAILRLKRMCQTCLGRTCL